MKRSERLKILAEEAGLRLRQQMYREKILEKGEEIEVFVLVSIKNHVIPVHCAVNDYKEPILAKPIDYLELSFRASNCLSSVGVATVEQLVAKSADELLEIRNFGETTLREVQIKLNEFGLKLKGDSFR